MDYSLMPYVEPLLAAAVITGSLAGYALHRRSVAGSTWFSLLMGAVTWWLIFYVLFQLSSDLEAKVLWSMLGSPGPALAPAAFFAFALEYSGAGRILTRRNTLLLLALPAFTLVLAATNSFHGLLWAHVELDAQGSLRISHGAWFWIWTSYSYVVMAAGTAVLIRLAWRSSAPHRSQAAVLAAGAIIPWVANMLHLAGIGVGPDLDATPFALALLGLAAAWALFGHRLLDIVPAARAAALESMSDGMLALDPQGRVVDVNPAALTMVAGEREQVVGRMVADLLPGWGDALARREEPSAAVEIKLGEEAGARWLDLRVSALTDRRGRPTGSLVVLREATREKRAERRLNEELRKIETLHDIARLMGTYENETDVLEITIYAAEKVLGLSLCHLALLQEDRLVGRASSTSLGSEQVEGIRLDRGPAARALKRSATYVVSDLREEPDVGILSEQFRSGIFCPLGGLGIMVALSPIPGAYTQEDARVLELLLGHTVEAVGRIRLQQSFRQQAEHDPLTGVYNRRHFTATLARELERAKRYGHPIGFLMVDINEFKAINDCYGHQLGDQILQGIAHVLLEQVREVDVVVRYGGDEFLVVLPETGGETDAVVERIRAAVGRWNEARPIPGPKVSLAIGASHWDPRGAETLEAMLQLADTRMYRDKELQGGAGAGAGL